MTQNTREYSSTEVYEAEINEEIVQRRRLAGLAPVGADDKTIAAAAPPPAPALAPVPVPAPASEKKESPSG